MFSFFSMIFVLALSPVLALNFLTHGTAMDSNADEHMRWQWKFSNYRMERKY